MTTPTRTELLTALRDGSSRSAKGLAARLLDDTRPVAVSQLRDALEALVSEGRLRVFETTDRGGTVRWYILP